MCLFLCENKEINKIKINHVLKTEEKEVTVSKAAAFLIIRGNEEI